jgi:protein-disulfide isomerase
VAAGGAIWGALVLLLATAGMGQADRERAETTAGYVFVLSVIGLAAVFYFAYASFVVLGVMCPFCVAVYVAVIGIFLVSSSATSTAMTALPGRLMRDLRAVFLHPLTASLAILWLVGSASLIAFFPREELQAPAAPAAAVGQPVEELDPAQLAEWHAWLDRQPRAADVAPQGSVKVLLVKFNDYQCPSCRMTWIAYKQVVDKYEAKYPGVFKFETRDFPLESECGVVFNHFGACEAAVAVRLAREKNRGAEMEEWLFGHQSELSRDTVAAAVKGVAGVTDFDARYAAVMAEVSKDAQLGKKLGVTGTPTFYLNGIRFPDNPRAAHLDAAIAYELMKAGQS